VNRRLKSVAPPLAVALLAFLLAGLFVRGVGGQGVSASGPSPSADVALSSPSVPSVTVVQASAPADGTGTTRSYAIATSELAGLPPDAQPGARLDLWVTWSPPVVPEIRVQKLIPGIVLEKVAPPVTPSGSAAAVFLVPVKDMSDLLWADRFGELSVSEIP
jgi:hypothetical protein